MAIPHCLDTDVEIRLHVDVQPLRTTSNLSILFQFAERNTATRRDSRESSLLLLAGGLTSLYVKLAFYRERFHRKAG